MAKKKDDDLNANERAAAAAERLSKILIEQGGILENNRSILDSISETFGIKARDFQASIKRTSDQTKELQEQIQDGSINLSTQITNSFSKVSETVHNKTGTFTQSVMRGLKSLSKIDANMADGLAKALETNNFLEFWDDFGEQGMKAFQKLTQDKKGFKQFKDFVTDDAIEGWKKQQKEIEEMNRRLQNSVEKAFSFRKTITTIGQYFTRDFMPKIILDKLYDFDQILNDTQREFGLAMDKNKAKFSELVGQTQIFGLSTKETGELMGKLGENLRTTNWDLLGTAAKDMAAIGKATGLSVDETAQLGSQMMFYGRTSKDVAKFTEETMQMAQKYGLNAKKVLQEVTKALPTMRSLGWQGGEKALRDMVIQAQKLGQNMDDLTASAKKLRTLEGSIEASADLALVGVNTNAIQMLAAARRGGKEFSSFVADLTKGIGQIKKDGSVEFDPIDVDRLQVVSDSVGISIEKIQDQIAAAAKRNAKIKLFPSSLGFSRLKPEEQEFLLNASSIGEDGKTIDLNASILGTKDLSKVSSSLIDGAMSQKKAMEEQAKENTSFNESVTNLKQSIYNIFTHLQPIIEKITDIVTGFNTWLNKFGETTKKWIAAGVLFSAVVFSVARNWMAGYWQGLGFDAGVNKGGIFSSFGKMIGDRLKGVGRLFGLGKRGGTGDITGEINNTNNNGGGASRGVGSFTEALKAMPSPAQLLALAAAIAAVGVAFVGIGYGIKLASEGLAELVKSFNGITNAGYALGAVVAVMGGFVGMLGVMIPLVGALGAVGTTGAVGLLALGASFVGIGYGIKLASDGLVNLVQSFNQISNAGYALGGVVAVMGSFVGMLYAMSPAIAELSLISSVGVVGLLALGASFVGIGYGIKLASDGLVNLVKSFNGVSDSLSALGGIVAVMGGFVGMLYAITPAIAALSTISTIGAIGLLSLGAAFIEIGYGIKLASDGMSNLVQSFNGIANAGYALGGIIATMGSFVGMLYAITPAITALGVAGTAGAIGLLALGAAFVGVGYGIKLASDGLANLVSSFAGLKDGSSAMWSVVAVMGGFVAISAILIPELAALGTSLAVFGTLGWTAVPPLLALGAAGIALGYGIKLAGEGISYMIKSFSEFTTSILKTTDSAPKLLALGGALAMISPSLILFGAAGILAAPGILAMSIALGLLAPSISIIIPSLEKLSSINSGNITNVSKSFGDLSLGLLSLSGIGVLFPLLALASGAISLLVPVLSNLVPTINELSKVDTNVLSNVASSLKSIIPSLFLFSTIGVLSPLLMGASIALGVLGKSLTYFSGLKISNLSNTIEEVSNSAGSLAKLSLIGLLSAPLALASATLMLLGPAISSLSNSISQISKLDWNSLKGVGQGLDAVIPALNKFSIFGFLAAPIMLGAASLVVLGKSMLSAASGFLEMSKIDWSSMDKIGNVLNNLLPSLSGFGLKGFAAAPGIYLMNSTIGSLATTMERLANPLDLATKSLGNMSDNIVRLKSAIQGLDTSKLNNLAAISDKFVGSTVQTAVVSKSEPSPQVAQKIKIDPIHINLKLNGKDVQEIIVKDTAYHI